MAILRRALRSLLRTPIVSAVTLLSLALGIGATSALFSVTYSLLLRPLPAREPHRLAILLAGNRDVTFWTSSTWQQIKERPELFEGAFAWEIGEVNLSPGGVIEHADALWASGDMFRVLGVPPVLGRMLNDPDDAPGGGPDGPVTVISYEFWQQHYQSAADVLGQTIQVESVPFTIVGVAPHGFFGPQVGSRFDLALPLGTEPLVRPNMSHVRNSYGTWFQIMVRLRTDQNPESATAQLRATQPQIREAAMPDYSNPESRQAFMVEPMRVQPAPSGSSSAGQRYGRAVMTTFAVFGLILLVTCANIASVLPAQGVVRRREMSLKLALGSSSARLARECFAESLVLACAGAGLGLLVAHWGSRLLVTQFATTSESIGASLGLPERSLSERRCCSEQFH